jgi:hypothetical protein
VKETGVQSDGSAPLRVAGRVVSLVLPASTVVALLYFFGYIYSQTFYDTLGLSVDRLELSTADFVTRSSHVMIGAFLVLVVGLAGAAVVHLCIRLLIRRQDSRLRWFIGSALAVVGVVLLVVPAVTRWSELWDGALWLIGVATAWYAAWLIWERARSGPFFRSLDIREQNAVGALVLLIGFGLITYGSFELTRVSAREIGASRAEWVEENCNSYQMIRLYSTVNLNLSVDGVRNQTLAGQEGDFRYRSEGLRLFNARNSLILVWSAAEAPLGSVFALPDDGRIRFEPVDSSPTTCPTEE